ncbi:pyruvoyl-dependent arginine decarboxylase [Natronosalvus rutilus]|uniref:arginine decarboxylase n=1 Tax=Natronosalvus rutilus TaxID=2953753 RepID=A0A9E7NAA2_9EURY|nr:pyruvoyl-dependent arginine decarboxylase [Natronosalvus rutilus]UTF53223.1 pyruvoyl-dependent arginine decarboxylase [Natronosalvus rutilus]
MSTIRVVWGSAAGPTKMAAYDGALADAGIENYNLVTVSSVIPATARVEAVGTAPDLGPVGNRLTVVQGHATAADNEPASAALAWAESDGGEGPGLFYETTGTDPDSVRERALDGLEAGQALRNWAFDEPSVQVETTEEESGAYQAAVVVAAYGTSEPIC